MSKSLGEMKELVELFYSLGMENLSSTRIHRLKYTEAKVRNQCKNIGVVTGRAGRETPACLAL